MEQIAQLKEYLLTVHPVRRTGAQKADFRKWLLRELKRAGYRGIASVETFRPEYWDRPPEWVIAEAYRTTRAELERSGCLS